MVQDFVPMPQCPECKTYNSSQVEPFIHESFYFWNCFKCNIRFSSRRKKNNMYIIIRDPFDPKYPEFSSKRKIYDSLLQAEEVVKSMAIKYPGSKFFIAKLIKSATIAPNVTIEDC